jgi:PBP1b-binding outer membrane lipoprotein LpoB
MKLNKSILGLVILFIFILSSCSQSRYGSLTRRTKANHIAQQVKKVDQVKKDVGLIVTENSDLTIEAGPDIDFEVYTHAFNLHESSDATPIAQKLQKYTGSKAKTMQLPATKKVKLVKQLVKSKMAAKSKANSDIDGVLYIVLIVILVLLILSLISNLIPALTWLLGLALLIFLIYLVLQLL